MNKQELIALLEKNRIDPSSFGQGKAKSIDDLLEEIEKGETTLSQRIVREVSVVTINVFANVDDKEYLLVEHEQIFDDGRKRQRNLPTSLSEKMHPEETVNKAVARGIKEELGVDNYSCVGEIINKTEAIDSPSFPGVLTIYRIQEVDVLLDPSEYKPDGYEEKDHDLTSYFRWVPC